MTRWKVLLYSIDLKIGTNQHKGINGKRDYPPAALMEISNNVLLDGQYHSVPRDTTRSLGVQIEFSKITKDIY